VNHLADMVDRAQVDRKTVRLYVSDAANRVAAVVNHLEQANMRPTSLTLTQPTLDDVFLQVTGQRFEVDTPAENKPKDENTQSSVEKVA
jgi:hypothetical protein